MEVPRQWSVKETKLQPVCQPIKCEIVGADAWQL